MWEIDTKANKPKAKKNNNKNKPRGNIIHDHGKYYTILDLKFKSDLFFTMFKVYIMQKILNTKAI